MNMKIFQYRKKSKDAIIHFEAANSVEAQFKLAEHVKNADDWEKVW